MKTMKINNLGPGTQGIVRKMFNDWQDECLIRGTVDTLCNKTNCKCNKTTINFLTNKGLLEKKVGSELYTIKYEEVF